MNKQTSGGHPDYSVKQTKLAPNLPNPFQEENRYFHVLDSGSITGILCHYELDDGRTLFWKPITEEFKIIPQSPLHLDSPYLRIWVDPVGYGYDKVRDDYKLLRYVHYSELDRGECQQIGIPYIRDVSYDNLWEIYSLRSNSWKKLNDSDNLHWFLQGFNGKRVYMNEMCHWWHLSQPSDDGGVDLVSFDFVNEVFFTTPTPFNIFSTRIYITGLNGSIAFISWIWDTTIFDISILGEIGAKESWIKLYSIGPFSCNIDQTIGAGYNGDIFFRKKDGNIVWYNLCTQMMEELCIKGSDQSHVLIYKKSFLPMGWEE
ncbi:hypothetical protein QL285_097092 [Trifolium repens]|jgi:molecular chaperone HtpG|nr:hypothetical protein QL285_097092 [Trifolium repens]